MQATKLGTMLLVDDFDACFHFYRDVLGLKASWGEDGSGYASFAIGDSWFDLYDRQAMGDFIGNAGSPSASQPPDRAIMQFKVEDLDAVVEQLHSRGASLALEPTERRDWGARIAMVRDPEGNPVQFFMSLPQEQWSDDLREEAQKYST